MFDHRHYPRFKEEAIVNLGILSPTTSSTRLEEPHIYHSRDISTSGMQLNVDTDISIGTLVQIEIAFNHLPETYQQIGHVIWSHGEIAHDIDAQLYRNIGIRFISASRDEHEPWVSAVSTLIKKHRHFIPHYYQNRTSESLL